jgi:Flp pilus assembly protein TadD
LDQYGHAELALQHATKINPGYARAWDNLAASLGAQDKLDEAMAACKRAMELRPEYPEASFKMGIIHFSKLEFNEAVTQFQLASHLAALTPYSDAFLAMTYSRLEQTAAAEEAVMSAVKADPKCELLWMAWNDLGLTLYAAGEYHRASIAYGEATMIKPDEPEAWFNLGVSYHQGGDLKAARDAYQQAVDLNVSLARAWRNLGIICSQTDDLPGAMKAFRQEVNWDPDNVRAWYDLGVTLEKLGNRDEAAVAYATVDALSPAKPDA